MQRGSWHSQLGFVFAAVGSAVGLANIWRFPYIVGQNGGAAFVVFYLMALLVIGFPVLLTEISIGRRTRKGPKGAMHALSGGSKVWTGFGMMIVITGLIVSAFYSVVAGRVLGYLIEAVQGNLNDFSSTDLAMNHYDSLVSSPIWSLSMHGMFMLFNVFILYRGVRAGIEKATSVMMPLLIIVLFLLMFKGLSMPGASEGLAFLFSPDWSQITPSVILLALGHAFFTLSLGQGTMITYGSYVSDKDNIFTSCLGIALMDTVIALMSGVAVFTIIFSVGIEPNAGPALIFQTLPYVFSQVSGGMFLGVSFFLLVSLAALTSEISAMEPFIAFLVDDRGFSRRKAVLTCGLFAFLLGVPVAFSGNLLAHFTIMGHDLLSFSDYFCTNLLIPIGGFIAIILMNWQWGVDEAFLELCKGAENFFEACPKCIRALRFCMCYVSPILMVVILLHVLGLL